MQEVIAKANHVRMSARKVRLVVDVIRGMGVLAALEQLQHMMKAASKPVEKTLRSALANAQHNFQLPEERLIIKRAFVDKGAQLKRWRPRAFGRAAPIRKHSCHITLILGEKEVKEEVSASKEVEKKEKKEKKEKVSVAAKVSSKKVKQ